MEDFVFAKQKSFPKAGNKTSEIYNILFNVLSKKIQPKSEAKTLLEFKGQRDETRTYGV